MAEEEAAWRVRVRQRVVIAHELFRNARQGLLLYCALVCMEAAEILALHGGSLDLPSLPLQSIDHLGPQEAALRTALGWLRESCVTTKDALESTEWCRGHLSTQILLVERHASIPDAMTYILAERNSAYHALIQAIGRTEFALGELITAQQTL